MKKIMIIIDTSRASGRKFLTGVEKYMATSLDWQVFIRPPDYLAEKHDPVDSWFPLDEIDGILARDALSTLNILKSEKPKVINDTQRESIPGCSTIVTDSPAIGNMSAHYFLGLGFRNFAYCGFRGLPWSQKRFISYEKTLKEEGVSEIFEYKDEFSGQQQSWTEQWKISEWLKQLPRPLCVFACNDDRAIAVLEACKTACLSVPEEVAVLGVDNDELMCNLSSPPLSSIELDFERAGFSAAQHLNELIQNNCKHKIIQVTPVEVIKRRSTDILAVSDRDVAAALIFIRNNFHKPIQTMDIVNATCVSKRELERRFKKILKKTIKTELERLRIELIKKKLLNNSQSISQVANELEFTDPEHFSRYFRNATGQSPTEFRQNI